MRVQKVPHALSSLPVAAETVFNFSSKTPSKLLVASKLKYASSALLFFSISEVVPLYVKEMVSPLSLAVIPNWRKDLIEP